MLKKYLIIFLVSMVPLIELRGAVPIAVGMNLPLLPSYIVCILGNMLPVPFIFFFARKVLEWGADKPVIGKFFTFCLEKGHKGGQKLQEKAGRAAAYFQHFVRLFDRKKIHDIFPQSRQMIQDRPAFSLCDDPVIFHGTVFFYDL